MLRTSILEAVWTGAIRLTDAQPPRVVHDGLSRFWPGPVACLQAKPPLADPCVLLALTEVEPGLTMADLLAEEFDHFLPDTALLVIAGPGATIDGPGAGRLAGKLLGEALVLLRDEGGLPLAHEARALVRLGAAALAGEEDSRVAADPLPLPEIRAGLRAVLRAETGDHAAVVDPHMGSASPLAPCGAKAIAGVLQRVLRARASHVFYASSADLNAT